jgi:hypothetical protein
MPIFVAGHPDHVENVGINVAFVVERLAECLFDGSREVARRLLIDLSEMRGLNNA